MKSIVTTQIILEKRTIRKDGTYPIKVRITYKRQQKYYSLKLFVKNPSELDKLSFTVDEFNKIFTSKKNNIDKDYRLKINAIETKIINIIEKIDEFSFNKFESRIFEKEITEYDIFKGYDNYIKLLNELEKYGTADTYKYSKESIKNYCKEKIKNFSDNSKLKFDVLTPFFLEKYEDWMYEKGNSATTIGIYLRNLKAIFNTAINDKIINKEIYPFGLTKNRKYTIPIGNNIKKALTKEEVEKIFNYNTTNLNEERAKDFWIFIYLCNGINLKDIALLKYKNIKTENNIEWIRAKTKDTVKKIKIIQACITLEMREIIKKWGNEKITPNTYIFSILNDEMDSKCQYNKVKYFTKNLNKYLKIIADNLNINKKVTTYSARHTFGTILNKSGKPMSFISGCYGHTSLETTLNYLDDENEKERIQHISVLTDFKSKDFKNESQINAK